MSNVNEEKIDNNVEEKQEHTLNTLQLLQKIQNDILDSFQSGTDELESYKQLISILEELIKLEKVEKFFNGNREIIDYFFQKFNYDIINNILHINYIPGENGDEIALQILILYCKLFITILKEEEEKYFLELIPHIFCYKYNFYRGEKNDYINISKDAMNKKLMDYENFNENLINRKFENVSDFLIENNGIDINTDFNEKKNQKIWIRSKINSISEDKTSFTALIPENDDNIITINISSLDYAKEGLITQDYEWRTNLKIGDRIFCYERNNFYPCTIINKNEEEINGLKNIIFQVGYRIYINDNEDFSFYSNYYSNNIKIDNNGQYIGEDENCDEKLYYYETRIQREKDPQNNINYNYDKIIPYEKKNYVIGRNMNFSYYFALLVQEFCKDESFYKFINALKGLTKSKYYCHLLNIFVFIIRQCVQYFHYEFIKEFSLLFIEFFQELIRNNLKEIKKDIFEALFNTFNFFIKFYPKEQEKIIFDSIIISSINLLKSDILDKKLYALKKIIKPYNINPKKYIQELVKAIKENNLISVIFNSHSHNQVIVQSKDLISILFFENALSKEDVLTIWEETKKRDAETRSVILNIFHEMGCNQEEREIIIDMILEENINDILSEEFDILLTNRNNYDKCIDFFLNGIFNNEINSNEKLNQINTYLIRTIHESNEQYILVKKVLEKCENYIENEDIDEEKARKSYILIIKLFNVNVHLNEEDKKKLIEIYKKSINKFIDNFKNKKHEYNQNDIIQKIDFAKIAYKYCEQEFGSFIQFLYEFLFEGGLSKDYFYSCVYEIITKQTSQNEKILIEVSELFKTKIFTNEENLENITQDGYLTILYLIFKLQKKNLPFVSFEQKDVYTYCIYLSSIPLEELELFNYFWTLLVKVKNNIISKEIWLTIISSYKKNNQEEKINEKLNEILQTAPINRIIQVIPDIIISSEEKGLIEGINPHISLFKIHFYNIFCIFLPRGLNSHSISITLPVATNDTLWEVKVKLAKSFKVSTDFFNLFVKGTHEKESNLVYNKLISEIIPEDEVNDKKLIMLRSKKMNDINEIPLLKDNEMVPELENILKDWFNTYSEDEIMNIEHLCEFLTKINFLNENIQSNDWRINLMRKYFEEGTNDLKWEGFRRYFYDRIIDSDKIDSVRDNLKNMYVRNDLIPGDVPIVERDLDKNKFLRYSLANDENFFLRLYNYYDESDMENNIKVYNFINTLCTNEIIKKNIEQCEKDYLNKILCYDKTKIIKINYNMRIIGDFIEQFGQNDSKECNFIFLFIKNDGFDLLIKLFNQLKSIEKLSEIEISTISLIRRIFFIICKCYLSKYEPYRVNFSQNIDINNIDKEIFEIIDDVIEKNNFFKLISNDFEEEDTSSINLVLFFLTFSEDDKLKSIIEKIEETNFTKNLLDISQKNKKYQNMIIQFIQAQLQIKWSIYLYKFFNDLYILCYKVEKTPLLIIYNLFGYIYSQSLENEELKFLKEKLDDDLINKIIEAIKLSFVGEYIEMEREKLEGYLHSLVYIKNGGEIFENFIKFIIKNIFSNNNLNISIIENEKNDNNYIDEENLIPQNNFLLKTSQQSKIIFSYFLTQVLKYYKIDYKLFFQQTQNDENETILKYKNHIPKYFKEYPPSKMSKKFNHVGLRNPHCICYMNSILQQFYMIPTFRYAILQNSDNKKENYVNGIDDNNYHQLQKLFAYLTLSQRSDFTPIDFCFSFKDFEGNPTDITTQKDSNEFLSLFIEKLEEELKQTPMKYLIDSVFKGQTCNQLICSKCNTIKNRIEEFNYLSLEVKNMNNIYDSLSKFIKGEEIEGYECDTCKQKVTVNKRNLLSQLPNVLIIYLQRICFDYEYFQNRKINSRLEFPNKLNLKNYTIESTINEGKGNEDFFIKTNDYYEYNLVGVNVHYGLSEAGHYFSFINTERTGYLNKMIHNDNNWLKFNDSVISEFSINEIEENCFGGKMNNNHFYNNDDMTETMQSAYMLVYEREIKSPLKIKVEKNELENNKNIITYNNNDENDIFKKYNIFTNDNEEIFNHYFFNSDKNEYYNFISFYSLKKLIPRKLAIEILLDNKDLENTKPNDENFFKLIEDVCLNFIKQAKENRNIDRNILNQFIDFVNKNVDYRNNNLKLKIKKEIIDILPSDDDDDVQ